MRLLYLRLPEYGPLHNTALAFPFSYRAIHHLFQRVDSYVFYGRWPTPNSVGAIC